MFNSLVFLCALLATVITAFDCGNDKLAEFNFDVLKGLHSISIVEQAWPSESNLTWFFNVCGPIKSSDNKEFEKLLAECPDDSQICGIKYLSVPGSEPLKTEVISFSNSLNPEYNINKEYKNSDKKDEITTAINIKLSGANWGKKSISSDVNFICDKSISDDKQNDKDNIKIKSWDNSHLEVNWYSSSLCADKSGKKPDDDKKEPDSDKDKKSSSSSFGFFKFIFNFFVIVGAVYVIGIVSLIVARRGSGPFNVSELIDEVTAVLVDVGKSVPGFLKEVGERLFGSNASRGGYSAV